MTTKTKVGAALALLACAALPFAAEATPVTVDFNVTSTVPNGSYDSGVLGTGYFTFDDSLMPLSGSGHIGNSIMGVPTLDLAFSWFGTAFDEVTASIATLTFANGSLTDWWIGGKYIAPVCGLMRYSCVSSVGAAPDFMLLASSGGSMNNGVNSGIGSGYGTVNWSVRSTSVPEPGTLALVGLGLIGFAAARRQKAA